MDLLFSYIVLAGGLAFFIALLYRTTAWRMLHKNPEEWVRLLFTVPSALINPLSENRPHEIANTAEFYKRVHELGIPFALEAAVHSVGEEIYFYISVPREHRVTVTQLIESLWPTGYLGEAEPYDLWLKHDNQQGSVSAGYFKLLRPYPIPLKTAHRGHFEPFLALLHALSTLKAFGEAASVQIIARPAQPETRAAVRSSLAMLRRGVYEPTHLHAGFRITPETLKAVTRKVSSPLFAVNYRIAVVARHRDAHEIFKRIVNVLHSHSHDATEQQNELAIVTPKDQQSFIHRFLHIIFDEREEMITNAEELATYFHLPGPTTAAPKIKR